MWRASLRSVSPTPTSSISSTERTGLKDSLAPTVLELSLDSKN